MSNLPIGAIVLTFLLVSVSSCTSLLPSFNPEVSEPVVIEDNGVETPPVGMAGETAPPGGPPAIEKSPPVAVDDRGIKDTSYQSEQTRTGEETNRFYGYAYDKGTAARIESAEVSPRGAAPGATVELIMTYLILTHSGDSVAVQEVREIWFEERMWRKWENRAERHGGTYRSTLTVQLPADAVAGKSKIVCIVYTPHSRDLREARFNVVDGPEPVR